jgi:hypothetical protein
MDRRARKIVRLWLPLLLLTAAGLTPSLAALADSVAGHPVTGVAVTENGTGLAGVAVSVDGTGIEVVTDSQGRFRTPPLSPSSQARIVPRKPGCSFTPSAAVVWPGPTAPPVRFVASSGGDLPQTAPTLTVSGTSLAAKTALCWNEVPMERLLLRAQGAAVRVTGLRVRDLGTLGSTKVALGVHEDTNKNGKYDPGVDQKRFVEGPPFDGGTKTWDFALSPALDIPNNGYAYLFLVFLGGEPGTVQLQVLDNTWVTVDAPAVVSPSNFPIKSGVTTLN